MDEIFYPKSVAVIGVSPDPDNLGQNIVLNMVDFGFKGIVYAVGPKGGVFATRRIYPSVLDIPDDVDLAVILIPAKAVPAVLEECGQKGIRWAIVETAGFREYGPAGEAIEDRMVEVAGKYGIRFVGPNCIGIINIENGFCVPFPRLKPFISLGDVSMISQSGGVGMSVMNHMANEGIGLNKFVSAGNMLNISAEDLLEYMIRDEGTKIIFIYLESIGDGRRLMELARRSPKPILVFKSNIGQLGKNIAASHTAALSSDDRVVDTAFRQCGIIRVHDATMLCNYMKTLCLPPLVGRKLAVISRSGGHAIVAADACEITGFDLAELPEPFIREIERHLRASVIKLTNPLDLGDLFDLDLYYRIVDETLRQGGVDGVVFLHTSLAQTERDKTRNLVGRLAELCRHYQKPVAVYISTDADEINQLRKIYAFPIFTQIVETFWALKMSHQHAQNAAKVQVEEEIPTFAVEKEPVAQLIQAAMAAGRDLLLHEAVTVLEHYGIPTVRSLQAANAEEAQAAAERIGYPVAMKVISKHISHKSDMGGVQLNLRNGPAVVEAFEDMTERIRRAYPEVKIDGVLVQPMAVGGRELILGGRQDKNFGPVVLVGLGGIFVEVFEQASMRIAPITRSQALSMIEELSGAPILMGTRGHKRSDIESLVEAILRLSQLLVDFPEIRELDINPLRLFQETEGCRALDARIVLS
jgi:acyl-CoA synthetase (NDP forming)